MDKPPAVCRGLFSKQALFSKLRAQDTGELLAPPSSMHWPCRQRGMSQGLIKLLSTRNGYEDDPYLAIRVPFPASQLQTLVHVQGGGSAARPLTAQRSP